MIEACGNLPSGGYKELFDAKSETTISADGIARALVLFGVRETADHDKASLWAFAWGAHMVGIGDRVSRTTSREELVVVFDELRDTAAEIVEHLVNWVKAHHTGEMQLPPKLEGAGMPTTED